MSSEMNRLHKHYEDTVKKSMVTEFSYKNIFQVPKLKKITVNCVNKEAVKNGKIVDSIVQDLTAISGQKPVVARAKKSVATFKLREGQPLGAYVTLRGRRMYDFLERLIVLTLPRVRDFKGISPAGFDGQGNYTMGIKEQIVFPEIDYDKIDKIRGLGINIQTTASTDKEAFSLLKNLGMPFREKK